MERSVDVDSKVCFGDGCSNTARYGMVDSRMPEFCNCNALAGMVNVLNNLSVLAMAALSPRLTAGIAAKSRETATGLLWK